jgi:hypothetical protein
LHVDIKKLARFKEIGHRVTGRGVDRSRGVGYEYVHVCVDDHTRLACIEVLPDEAQESAVGSSSAP